jgi:hypothetical protein
MTDNANNDPLSDALGINPLPSTDFAVKSIIANAHDDSAITDFETARSNIHTMIENGQEAMYKLAQIADSSQHPRAFEVLAKLMDTMLQANKDLMDLQTKIREIKNVDEPNNAHAKTVTNNLFVGSTAELQKVIADMKK